MESPSREPGSRLGERAPVTTEPSHSSCSCAPKLSSPVSALLAREPIANGRMSRCWSCAGIAGGLSSPHSAVVVCVECARMDASERKG
jgi:hypothetical protein